MSPAKTPKPKSKKKAPKKSTAKVGTQDRRRPLWRNKRKFYKVLVDGRSCHGGNLAVVAAEGRASRVTGTASPTTCRFASALRGFHLTDAPTHWYVPTGCQIFEVEPEGIAAEEKGDRKVVARGARLIRQVTDAVELAALGIYLEGEHTIRATTDKVVVAGLARVTAYGSARR
jgi:hypothetical protein